MASEFQFCPNLHQFTANSPPPVQADVQGATRCRSPANGLGLEGQKTGSPPASGHSAPTGEPKPKGAGAGEYVEVVLRTKWPWPEGRRASLRWGCDCERMTPTLAHRLPNARTGAKTLFCDTP
jgi:hypothetical protein